MTHANLTVTASGQASGTLSEPVAGKSAIAWSGDRLYLKGDSDFWAQQDPLYGTDLTSSGRWIAPKKRSGYYLLDSFAVNAGSLSPKSLAALVTQVTSDPEAVQEDAGTIEGHKAISYTAQGWTVVLASASPYTVLAIGGEPHQEGPVKSAAWHSSRRATGGAGPADHRGVAAPADYSDSDYSSYLLMVPKPATNEQTTAARSTAAAAASAAVPPATSSEAVSTSMGPDFTITNNSAYLCTSNPCSYSFTVTNSGDEAGEATLYLSLPQVPDQPHPLGTLQPKQSKNVSGTRPNIAIGTGRTVKHTDYAWVYSSAEYGSDPKVGSRLHARNLRPDDVSVGTPLKPDAAKLLDLMTKDTPASDTGTGEKAVDALNGANNEGELPDLAAIANSGRLENPEDLREILPTTDQADNRRVLQQVAQLLQTDRQAKVTWAGPYKVNGKTYRADYIYTTTRQGQQIKRAVRAKTVGSPEKLGSQMSLGAEQLNGERPGSGNAKSEKAPPGFERVLRINLEPAVGPLLALASTADLEKFLSTGEKFRQARESLCQPNGRGPRVDRLVIVNDSGTHQWTDLRRLGVRCAGPGGAPASPSAPSSDKPDHKPTCLDRRPLGAEDNGADGWTYYSPIGRGERALGAVACLAGDTSGGSEANPNSPGMSEAKARAARLFPHSTERFLVNSCHLIPNALGGKGITANLSPCWAKPVNVGIMTGIQACVTGLMKSHVVQMTVVPEYMKDVDLIPFEFRFQIQAWDHQGNAIDESCSRDVQNLKEGEYLNED
ncbi:hypothetical protein AB0C96_36705 [Streptomyces sp. NPDC048506]|uniref:hypothetical protein n=1 Tax=Streptomyces sp. NPDC048506 TaxID=3155028 RepID=UPI0034164ED8